MKKKLEEGGLYLFEDQEKGKVMVLVKEIMYDDEGNVKSVLDGLSSLGWINLSRCKPIGRIPIKYFC